MVLSGRGCHVTKNKYHLLVRRACKRKVFPCPSSLSTYFPELL